MSVFLLRGFNTFSGSLKYHYCHYEPLREQWRNNLLAMENGSAKTISGSLKKRVGNKVAHPTFTAHCSLSKPTP